MSDGINSSHCGFEDHGEFDLSGKAITGVYIVLILLSFASNFA